MRQTGRALSELNIEILCANSSHAKGRGEGQPNAAGIACERSDGLLASSIWKLATLSCKGLWNPITTSQGSYFSMPTQLNEQSKIDGDM